MRTVLIKRYATLNVVGDDIDDEMVHGILRDIAVDGWREQVSREGYKPIDDEPDTELQTKVVPEYYIDPETGEEFKLPDRAWGVVGRVLPKDVPLPPNGFPHAAIVIP